jgi:osmoprotectant transport system ATP-binding protein
MPPAIEFERVGYVHADGSRALADVSLRMVAGRTLAIVGRSGAGKSTLLRLVNGLLQPTTGEIRVEGRPTSAWDPIRLRRRVGYVLQDVGLFPHMTVAQNIGLLPRLEQWPVARTHGRVRTLLDLVGLDPDVYGPRLPGELSGGQRQRVGVARALVLDPPILLMDEPFGALDPLTRHELHQEYWRIQERLQRTVVVVTHDLREALALGQDLGVVDGGRLVAAGTAAQVLASDHVVVRGLLETLESVTPDTGAGVTQ